MKQFLIFLLVYCQLFTGIPAFAEQRILTADIVEGQDSGKNYAGNKGHFEKNVNGVSAYADAAGTSAVDGTGGAPTVTCTRTTSSPISGDGMLLITKDAANRQGNGCSMAFSIDSGDKATMQQIEFSSIVPSGTFVAGTDTTNSDIIVQVYDVTNAVIIPVQGTGRLFSNSSTLAEPFKGYFQTASNSTSYRLIWHVTSTSASAYTVGIDNVKIKKSQLAPGAIITEWATYSCNLIGGTNGSTFTNQTTTCKSRRTGDTLELDIYTTFTGTPGTGTGDFRWTIPSGLSIDTAKMSNTGNNATLGSFSYTDSGTNFKMAAIPVYGATTNIGAMADGASASAINTSSPITWTTNDNIKIVARVPITGWSGTTQVADDYTSRVVALALSTNAGSIATSATTWTTMTFSTPGTDTVNGWNGTDTYTVKSAGQYEFGTMACQNSAAANYMRVGYQINAASEVVLAQGIGKTGGSACPSGAAIATLAAGDTVKFKAFTESTEGIGATRSAWLKKVQGPNAMSLTEVVAASYQMDTAQTLTSTATIKYNLKIVDTHNAYNTTTGVFTAPVAGLYEISAQLFSINATAEWTPQIRKNSSAVVRTSPSPVFNTGTTINNNQSMARFPGYLVELAAGGTIDIYNSAAIGTGTVYASQSDNYLSIKKVK